VLVRSAGAAYERRKGWRRWLGAGHAEPHGGKEISPWPVGARAAGTTDRC